MDNREWRGSPLDIVDREIDPRGIKEVVIEYDNGGADIFRPRRREEFRAYELHQMAYYLETVVASIKKSQRR